MYQRVVNRTEDGKVSHTLRIVTKSDTTHFMMDPTEGDIVGSAMENHSTSESYDQTTSILSNAESDKSLHLGMMVPDYLEYKLEETCSSYMNDIEADHFDISTIQRGLLSLRASA